MRTRSNGEMYLWTSCINRKIVFADNVDERHETPYEGIDPHGYYCVPSNFFRENTGVISVYGKMAIKAMNESGNCS